MWLKFLSSAWIILVAVPRVASRFGFTSFSNLVLWMVQVSSEPCFNDLVAYATSRFVLLRFEFSFMNVSSFEPYSDHFARISYVVAFQIRNVG